jgi:hypothetical protein
MAELERDLREIGRQLAWPGEPDLVPRVQARLAAPSPARRLGLPRRRVLVLAFAVLVVAVGAAFAVAPARTAILRFFHIGNETIERVPTLPSAQRRSPVAGLAGPMSLAQATKLAGFQPVLPPKHGKLYAHDGIVATYLGPRTVLTEATGDLIFTKKVISPGSRVEPVTVNGHDGLWISGAQHVLMYLDSTSRMHRTVVRIAGNVLVWAQGSVTLRIEGPRTRAEAFRFASSIR